jgi:hypothetical protein
MRLPSNQCVTDHDLLTGIGVDDHHAGAVAWKVSVNGLSIPPGVNTYQVALPKSGCRIAQGILRGNVSMAIQGHTGVWFLGGTAAGQSSAMGLRPYPSGGGGYAGGYSRLHGDTYLSHMDFGPFIYLNDVYINGSNLVLSFVNTDGSNRTLTVYGSGVCK